MKKWLIGLTIAGSCFFATDTLANSSVIWDGAEVVSGQVGKMTFSKDVKVYKKNTDETFTSLVVKKGNFFRVYDVEQSSIGKVYYMSGGYRVQATDLVIYREVPLSIQKQVGIVFKIGTNIYASSKGGLAIKPEPTSAVDSIGHTKQGAILKVLGMKDNYVKVMYDPGQGADFVIEGYVPKNYVSAIPAATTQYLTEEVHFGKQIDATFMIGTFPRGHKVSTYFTTASGYTYISVENNRYGNYGFVKTTSLSKEKVIDKQLQKIESSANIAFDTTKEIHYRIIDTPTTSGVSTYGVYRPVSPNTLEGKITSSDGDYESTKVSSFQANVTDKELVYRIDDMTVKLAFPLKVGDALEVNGEKYKVEKILETYTPHHSTYTVENAVFAGDFVIGKGYIYQGSQYFQHVWH